VVRCAEMRSVEGKRDDVGDETELYTWLQSVLAVVVTRDNTACEEMSGRGCCWEKTAFAVQSKPERQKT
jgi:hypothetical protein